jgi:transposase
MRGRVRKGQSAARPCKACLVTPIQRTCATQSGQSLSRSCPLPKSLGRPRADLRAVLYAIRDVTRSSAQWRMVPRDLVPWGIAWSYFRRWRNDGTWQQLHDHLRADVRRALVINLESGVRWERLTVAPEPDFDLLHVTNAVGGARSRDGTSIRHAGREYSYVISGRVGVSLQFEAYELGAGDSLAFDSHLPHRVFNLGDEPAQGIWFVVGRRGEVLPTHS